ncbi:MAG: hypothetical protein ACK4YF_05055 [Exilispira sp.]
MKKNKITILKFISLILNILLLFSFIDKNPESTNNLTIYSYNENGMNLYFNISKDLLFDYFVLYYFDNITLTDYKLNKIFNDYVKELKIRNRTFCFEINEMLTMYYINYLPIYLLIINDKNLIILIDRLYLYYENYYKYIDNIYKKGPEDKKKSEYQKYQKKMQLKESIENILCLKIFYERVIKYINETLMKNNNILCNVSKFIHLKRSININMLFSTKQKGSNLWLIFGESNSEGTILCSYNFLFYQVLLHELIHLYFSENFNYLDIYNIIKNDQICKQLTYYYYKIKYKSKAIPELINIYIDNILFPPMNIEYDNINNNIIKNIKVYNSKKDSPFGEYLASILSHIIIDKFNIDFELFYNSFYGIKSRNYYNLSLNAYFFTNTQINLAVDMIQKYRSINYLNEIILKEYIISCYRILLFYMIFNNIDYNNFYKNWVYSRCCQKK